MLIWLSGLSAIPETVYDAARVDGAGRFTQIFRITLPNMKRSFFYRSHVVSGELPQNIQGAVSDGG